MTVSASGRASERFVNFDKITYIMYQGQMNWIGFQGRGFKVNVKARSDISVSCCSEGGGEASTSTLRRRSISSSLRSEGHRSNVTVIK